MTTLVVPSPHKSSDERIPEPTRVYFQERMRVRLHQFLLRQFLRTGMTRRRLAEKINRRPEQVTRLLGTPSNMTLDTLSDLLLAMDGEPTFDFKSIVADAQVAGKSTADTPRMASRSARTRKSPRRLQRRTR